MVLNRHRHMLHAPSLDARTCPTHAVDPHAQPPPSAVPRVYKTRPHPFASSRQASQRQLNSGFIAGIMNCHCFFCWGFSVLRALFPFALLRSSANSSSHLPPTHHLHRSSAQHDAAGHHQPLSAALHHQPFMLVTTTSRPTKQTLLHDFRPTARK